MCIKSPWPALYGLNSAARPAEMCVASTEHRDALGLRSAALRTAAPSAQLLWAVGCGLWVLCRQFKNEK